MAGVTIMKARLHGYEMRERRGEQLTESQRIDKLKTMECIDLGTKILKEYEKHGKTCPGI